MEVSCSNISCKNNSDRKCSKEEISLQQHWHEKLTHIFWCMDRDDPTGTGGNRERERE